MMKNDTRKTKKFHWVPGFIRHDFWRKLCALLFAALVTAVVYSNKRKSMETDVNFNNVKPEFFLEEGYEWRKSNPQTITLTLRGPRNVLSDLKPEDFEIRKSIAEKEYAANYVELNVNDVICHHPKAGLIQVTGISPSEYKIHVQKIVRKKLDIKTGNFDAHSNRVMIDHVGKLPPGYFFDGAEILDDTTVNVSGPEHLVKSLENILIEPIQLDNHVATFVTTAKLISPDAKCTLERDSVRIKIHIGRYLIKKFSNIPVRVIDNSEEGTVNIPESSKFVTVELLGEKNELDALPDEKAMNYIYALIRKSDLRKGINNTVHIQCMVVNKQLRVLSVEPSAINGVALELDKEQKPPIAEEKKPPVAEEKKPLVAEAPKPLQNAEVPKNEEGEKTDDPQKK